MDEQKNIVGRAQTILGPVDPESLGVTLTHEHLLLGIAGLFIPPKEAAEQELANQPVSLENLNWIRHHYAKNLDNALLRDEQTAIDEAMFFKKAGGNTIVELTCTISLGRDPQGLARIARATGLNIIMSTGFYEVYSGYKPGGITDRPEEELVEHMVQEIIAGVDDTELRAGIIGELGMAWPFSDTMRKVLRAGAHAQRLTGAAMNIHPPLYASTKLPRQKDHEDVVMEVIKTVEDAGGDLTRTIISHVDVCCFTPSFRRALAKTGCYLEYDCFGFESYLDRDVNVIDTPNDARRIDEIMQLIDEGFLGQILISCDHCLKHTLRRYGGWGYDHILTSVVPLMRTKGMSAEQIDTLLVENPRRVLTIIEAR